MSSAAEDVVAAFLGSWGPDWPTFRSSYLKYLSEDCVYENTGMPTVVGHADILALIDAFAAQTGLVSGEVVIKHSLASDTVVLNERTESWQREDGSTIIDPPVPVMGAFEVRDGKITHWRDYWDSAAVVAILSTSSASAAGV